MAKFNFIAPALAAIFVLLRRYGWLLVAAGVSLLAISAITEREGTRITAVRPAVEALPEGENLVTPEDIAALLIDSLHRPLDDLLLSDIDVESIEALLEEQAFVGEAEAYVDADLVLHVRIDQRVPLLRIIADNGQNYYLDREGVRLPLSKNSTVRVPVVTGDVVPWSEDLAGRVGSGVGHRPDHPLAQLWALGQALSKDEFLRALVEQIHVREDGELVLAPKVGDQIIYLGHYDPALTPARLERLKVFYREGLPYQGWRKYKSFDLRYAGQVVAKKA